MNARRQKGFGMLTVIIGAVVLMGTVVAVAAAVRSNNASNDTATAQASAVLSQASALLTAYELVVAKTGAAVSSIKFDNSDTGLYNDSITGLTELAPIPNAMESGSRSNRWQLGRGTALTGFGVVGAANGAGAETAFYLPGVTTAVCAAVNRSTAGSAALSTDATESAKGLPPTSGAADLKALFQTSLDPVVTASANQLPATATIPSIVIQSKSPLLPTVGCFTVGSGTTAVNVAYAVARVL